MSNLKLKELRSEKNISQKELTNHINYTQSMIAKWENGINEPTARALKEIADFFGVSIDYLVGRENYEGNVIIKNELEPDEEKALSLFRNLNRIAQKRTIGYMEGLLSAPILTRKA